MRAPGLALVALGGIVCAKDAFTETLDLRSLDDGKLSARLTFELATKRPTAGSRADSLTLHETELVSSALSDLIDRHGVAQLGLSLARGRWRPDRWAASHASVPAGTQVWAWLDDGPRHEALQSWHGLTHALGGLVCASLSTLSRPEHVSFPPRILFPPASPDNSTLLVRGLLPIEYPCTENLSPLLSLLPCRARAGLASLLDPHRLFDADWQALELGLVRLGPSGRDGLHASIVVHSVMDPVRRDIAAGGNGKRDWSISSLFGRALNASCPASDSSEIHVLERPQSIVVPAGETFRISHDARPPDVSQTWPNETSFQYPSPFPSPRLSASRILLAVDQRGGTLGVDILTSPSPERQTLLYTEELPWWLTPWLHTLSVKVDGKHVETDSIVDSTVLVPAIPRRRPTSLALTLVLPKDARRVRLTAGFATSLLRYTEYPPDAHRGFDVPPANVLLLSSPDRLSAWTTGALVELPTPDFSMPYNVIIVTSTVIALFYGSVFNLLVRSFTVVSTGEP